eukprot:m.124267 g.124267  ORF g.124267 m.124267 type:complete len:685 (+) comp23414_c0_seq2:178-2232(+)
MSDVHISGKKLKAFTTGRMGAAQKTKFEQQKQEQEQKKKRAELEAAKVFAEFAEDFATEAPKAKTFIRAGYADGSKTTEARKYEPKPDRAALLPFPKHDLPLFEPPPEVQPPSKSKKKTKKPTQMELLKEQLKREQQARDLQKQAEEQVKSLHGVPRPSNAPLLLLPAHGSFDTGDPSTTNVCVGNLPMEGVNELTLCQEFGKFGPLASVKIMWPRKEEDFRRGSLTGFVAFMKRDDAVKAYNEAMNLDVKGNKIRLSWGKAIPLPAEPFFVHSSLTEQETATGPTGLPFSAVPVRGFFPSMAPNDATIYALLAEARVYVQIPKDRQVRQKIHSMIENLLIEGPAFEQAVLDRVKDDSNPLFTFLTDIRSPEHAYYRWKLYSMLQGDASDSWREKPFIMVEGGPKWYPPSVADLDEEEVKKGHLPAKARDKLEGILRNITMERASIADAMYFCIQHSDASEEIVDVITESLCILETPILRKLARLFLVSDLLHNSGARVRNASYYRRGFEAKLPAIFEHMNETLKAISGRMRAEKFKKHILNCLQAWTDAFLFTPDFFANLKKIFLAKKTDKLHASTAPAIQEKDAAPTSSKPAFSSSSWSTVVTTDNPASKTANDNDSDDVDGVPLDVDEDVDGKPLDDDSDDVDGVPLDDDDDDVDGTPMDELGTVPLPGFTVGSIGSKRKR